MDSDNKSKKNHIWYKFIVATILVLLSSVLAVVLMYCVFLIPTSLINENAKLSAQQLDKEGPFPALFWKVTHTLDNNTDSLMILHAQDDCEHSTLERCMYIYRHYKDPFFEGNIDSIMNHYISGQDVLEDTYSRYWHGYLIVLKPLLIFFSITEIRILNAVIQLLLMGLLCWLLYIKNYKNTIPAVLLTYLLLKPVCTFISLQFSPCYYTAVIGSILVLIWPKKISILYLFSCIGILCVFFDFLTYPIFTFCIPATLYLVTINDKLNIKSIKTVLLLLIFWFIGYAGMWMLKWLYMYLFFGRDAFMDIFHGLILYTSVEVASIFNLPEPINYILQTVPCLSTIIVLYGLVLFTPVILIVALYLFWVLKHYFINSKVKLISSIDFKRFLPYLFVGVLPVIWYILLSGHSLHHFGFTYKSAISSIFAILVFIANNSQALHKRFHQTEKTYYKHAMVNK